MGIGAIAMIVLAAVAIAAIIIYDIPLALDKIKGNTFSELTLSAAKASFFLTVAVGILLGHFFWPKYGGWDPPGWLTITVLASVGALFLGFDIYEWAKAGVQWSNPVVDFIRKYPIVLVLSAIPLGHWIWPQ